MNGCSPFLLNHVARLLHCPPSSPDVAALCQSLKEEYGSLGCYLQVLCHRFWKYPGPRRVQHVYDMACLYGKVCPYVLAVYLEELRVLLIYGFTAFVFVHNKTWNDWERDARPNK